MIAGPLDLYLVNWTCMWGSGLVFGCLDLRSWRLISHILVVEFQVFGSALRAHNLVSFLGANLFYIDSWTLLLWASGVFGARSIR